MIRKKLLAMPALPATQQMIETAAQDRGSYKKLYGWQNYTTHVYDHDWYFRAVVQDGILKVAMYSRSQLVLGDTDPKLEIYINRKEEKYITWIPSEKRWSKARISYLDDKRWSTIADDWEEPGARQMVNDYLQNGEIRIYNAVDRFQSSLKNAKLARAHQSEKDRIDAVMDLVPDLPKDWEDWIYKSAYSRDMYLIYHPGEDRAYCTACGKETTRKNARHREKVTCPNCHKRVTALSWNKQKSLTDTKDIGILQKLKDGSGYCLTVYGSKICRNPKTDWKVDTTNSRWWKKSRHIINSDMKYVRKVYEYGDFKNTGEYRWCNQIQHGSYYYDGPSSECVLYHRNLKRLRKGTPLNYMPVEELFRHCEGWYSHVTDQLYALAARPELEYMIKAGLYSLAWDITRRGCVGNKTVDWNQRKLWNSLRIRKDRIPMCVRMDITERQLKTLQKAEKLNINLTSGQIAWYSREFGPEISQEIWQYGHVEKTKAYIENKNIRGVDYIDYLHELKKLRIRPTEDVLYPRDFQAAHERTSQQLREKEEALEKKKVKEKDRILKGMLPELEELYLNTKADEYLMVLPTCKEDFNREGRENHNCVGGSYFDKMLRGDSVVLFLRNREDPDKAFCTVEMDGSKVKQCRAIRNSEPPQEVKTFMEKYSREVARRIMKKQEHVRINVAI